MTGSSPRRRQSPAVYRRRRLLLLIALLVAVAVVVWLLVAQPWRGAASESSAPEVSQTPATSTLPVPTPGATPGATPTGDASADDGATPSPSGTPGTTVAACSASDVTVEAVTDKTSYASDQQPAFTIRLTNNGGSDCTLNVGTSSQVYTVTSGSDTWWRSTDCQSKPSDMIVTLEAGQTVSSAAPLIWDRTRSAVATCGDDSRPRAAGGGASYHLSVSIGGIESAQTTQFLLY
ncbi:hypothetical protein [Microbacterium sp. SSM24]|uniref:hypothetical protein n=1 Tax=Microbacterium sp. SSM24 TaxID=2991714 RepID=UPI0022272248|nr:hypothetical protein [Microbacterium sp. SSM24]MCW3492733.1 hypothetical protein [Microbacterium sp. SSM24]